MATQGVFTLPANTRFGVTAFANSSGTQTVNVLVNNETAATFSGQSTNNAVIGTQVLNSGSSGKVQVQVSVNGRPSDLVSAQVILTNELNFALVDSEDGTDNDYNDAVVVINWPLG
ncbi:fucose-binding lectin LecB [Pseudomonas aeruginosa]|uniref:Fucophilic lectin LecB type-2 n=2 Tax=Gammaproteobacteria TaxID=1236 RepID=A0A0N9LSG8_PSEAI|nr:fucophilic lectin LecB type-2 [Pseudomonas aeruginosa]